MSKYISICSEPNLGQTLEQLAIEQPKIMSNQPTMPVSLGVPLATVQTTRRGMLIDKLDFYHWFLINSNWTEHKIQDGFLPTAACAAQHF